MLWDGPPVPRGALPGQSVKGNPNIWALDCPVKMQACVALVQGALALGTHMLSAQGPDIRNEDLPCWPRLRQPRFHQDTQSLQRLVWAGQVTELIGQENECP